MHADIVIHSPALTNIIFSTQLFYLIFPYTDNEYMLSIYQMKL